MARYTPVFEKNLPSNLNNITDTLLLKMHWKRDNFQGLQSPAAEEQRKHEEILVGSKHTRHTMDEDDTLFPLL